jgi:hypothetical protein
MYSELLNDILQILTGVCVVMWLLIAAKTVIQVARGKMFFAPCLGTDLFSKKAALHKRVSGKV